jgi:prophage regulatory protein
VLGFYLHLTHRISVASRRNQRDADVTVENLRNSPDRFLPKPEVLRIAGFSAATLWREIKAGRFPGPVAISANRVGFLQSEIHTWVTDKLNARGLPYGATRADDGSHCMSAISNKKCSREGGR